MKTKCGRGMKGWDQEQSDTGHDCAKLGPGALGEAWVCKGRGGEQGPSAPTHWSKKAWAEQREKEEREQLGLKPPSIEAAGKGKMKWPWRKRSLCCCMGISQEKVKGSNSELRTLSGRCRGHPSGTQEEPAKEQRIQSAERIKQRINSSKAAFKM